MPEEASSVDAGISDRNGRCHNKATETVKRKYACTTLC